MSAVSVSPTTPTEIALSRGDLALVLAGDKTLHFFASTEELHTGDIVHLVHGEGPERLVVPACLESAMRATGNFISEEALKTAGRYVAPPVTERENGAASSNAGSAKPMSRRAARQRANESGAAFLAAMEPAMPANLTKHVTAAEMAGAEPGTPVQQLRLHIPRVSDYPLVNEAGIRPQESAARADTLRQVKQQLKHAAALLAPEMLHAHRYVNKQVTRREHVPPPDDASILLAMRFLAQHRTVRQETLLKSLNAPSQWFSQELALQQQRATALPHDENRDGIGHGQYLVDYPSIETTLGTGVLATMGAVSRMAVRKPISQKHVFYEEVGVNRPLPRTIATVAARQQTRGVGNRAEIDYSFDVPVLVDFTFDAEPFYANDITDAMADEHGYATIQDMRRGLGIGKNENPLLYSYAILPALPKHLPENEDQAGKRLIERRNAAYAAWKKSPDASLTLAKAYLQTLEPEDKLAAEQAITPRRHRDAEHAPVVMKHNGKGPVPAEVQAIRELGPDAVTAAKPMTARDHQRNRVVANGKKARETKQKITSGPGWVATVGPRRRDHEDAPALANGVSYRRIPEELLGGGEPLLRIAESYPTITCTPGEMLLAMAGLQTRLFSHLNPAPTNGKVYWLCCPAPTIEDPEFTLRVPIIAKSVAMVDAAETPDAVEWMQAGHQYHHRNGHARLHNMGFAVAGKHDATNVGISKNELRAMLKQAGTTLVDMMGDDPVDRDATLNRADLFCRSEHHLNTPDTLQRVSEHVSALINPPPAAREIKGWGAVAEKLAADARALKESLRAQKNRAQVKASRVEAKAKALLLNGGQAR